MTGIRKRIMSLLPMLAIGLGVFLVLLGNMANKAATEKNRGVGLSNNTYLRIMTCIASVSPTKRTPEYTKSCYETAEGQTGVHVTRFGDGR